MNNRFQIKKEDNMENLLVKFPIKMIERMNQLIRSGQYGSRAEIIRAALRQMLGDK